MPTEIPSFPPTPPAEPCTVLKRDGYPEPFDNEKIHASIDKLMFNLDTTSVSVDELVHRIHSGLPKEITTVDLQLFAARTAASMATRHPDFSLLAGRLYTRNIHTTVDKSFSTTMITIAKHQPTLLDGTFLDVILRHGKRIDSAIKHSRDDNLDYHSACTMTASYLLKINGQVAERPQHAFMRVAVALHLYDLTRIFETYDALSMRLYTHASPIMFNAGTARPAYPSCFLYHPPAFTSDITHTTLELERLWSADGGIGAYLGHVPARKSKPTPQPGVPSLLRLYDAHAVHLSTVRPHRKATLAAYIPIWHADVREVIVSRTNKVPDADRLWRVYPALWIPDVFMQRLRSGGKWSLYDPVDVPKLSQVYGTTFSGVYTEYESNVKPVTRVDAKDLWKTICEAQRESGAPFIMYADSVNSKNNEKHLGIIQGSNLCTEIVQYSAPDHTAVCTLASVCLPRFVTNGKFDFDAFSATVALATRNTDGLIDTAGYPDQQIRTSALSTRSIGVGVQGLWDTFMLLKLDPQTTAAWEFNKRVFESLYFSALDASCSIAERRGPYPRYFGSPASKGSLQCDMWEGTTLSDSFDYTSLRERIKAFGLRNSMLTAQMPTATTAHAMGVMEGVEPYLANIVTYRTHSGDYTSFNVHLVNDLVSLGLWTDEVRSAIIRDRGSIQTVDTIPKDVRNRYRTAWELSPTTLINLAADRGPFIDQTQSMSLYPADASTPSLTEIQLNAWQRGLKTGVYYLRTRPSTAALAIGLSKPTNGYSSTTTRDRNQRNSEEPGESSVPYLNLDPSTCPACSG